MSLRNFKSTFRARYGAATAFILLALAGGVAVQRSAEADAQRLYKTQIQSCERGNVLREQVSINVEVLDSFLSSAEVARRAAGTTMDTKTADSYHDLKGLLAKIDPVNCEKAINKP